MSGRASLDGRELCRVNRDEIERWATPLVGSTMGSMHRAALVDHEMFLRGYQYLYSISEQK